MPFGVSWGDIGHSLTSSLNPKNLLPGGEVDQGVGLGDVGGSLGNLASQAWNVNVEHNPFIPDTGRPSAQTPIGLAGVGSGVVPVSRPPISLAGGQFKFFGKKGNYAGKPPAEAVNAGDLQDQLTGYGASPAAAAQRAAYVASLPKKDQQKARDSFLQEARQYRLDQFSPLGGDTASAKTAALINSLVNQVLPAPQAINPAMLMNAQSQFMAPYLSHLENMGPETKAAYAQQAMTFPLAYQIQQQVAHQSNINDLRQQALGGLLGQYFGNQASSAASPDLLAGSTGQ